VVCALSDVQKGEKKMKRNSNTNYLDLITSIDVLNTVNGGVSEPQMNMNHHEDYREIRLKVPGIKQEDVHVEVHNNNLSIYYFINMVSTDKLIQLPRFVYNRSVPYFIDINKINARLENEELVVKLPFNRLANGYHKEIKISQN
jgi:HSP20 family molecular chaperone IbpA